MRDLVDGVTFPAGPPTSPGPPTTWLRRAFSFAPAIRDFWLAIR